MNTAMLRQVPVAVSPFAPAQRTVTPRTWRPASMGRKGVGQSKAGVAAFGAVPLLISATLGAGAAWVGFSTGSREKGLLSILGYVFGIGGALSAIGGTIGAVLWVAGVSILPEDAFEPPEASSNSLPGEEPPASSEDPFSDPFFNQDPFGIPDSGLQGVSVN